MSNKGQGVCAARGFLAGGIHAGIKHGSAKDDLAVIYSEVPCNAAAVYTSNVVKAAPLQVTKQHLEDGKAQAIVINSGNANAAAKNGIKHAEEVCEEAARVLDLQPDQVLCASTGVIGQELPVKVMLEAIGQIELKENGSEEANVAIMTTDTIQKTAETAFKIDGVTCHMGGICKGSGMIHPNMGTMLGFITTDCSVSTPMLQEALKADVKTTFNRISVDGDTSTNDMVIVLANGLAKNKEITGSETEAFRTFKNALHEVMQKLAILIAKDGEGASRLITCTVSHAADEKQAETLARSVVSSSLLKAAMAGQDANWGRVICAMGYSGASFEPEKTDIAFGSKKGQVKVCESGHELPFDDDVTYDLLSEDEVTIDIDIHEGEASATCWGCDLTYEYVTINKDYRS